VQFGSAQAVTQSGTWTVATNADGALSGGAAASKSFAVGGVYNSSPPSLTTGQQSAFLLDSTGNLLVSIQSSSGTNLNVNLSEISGSAVAVGASGVQRIAISGHSGITLDAILGAAVPASALLVGGSDGTDLRAIKTDASGNVSVIGTGTFAVQNTAATPAGSNVIGHVIADSGSTTAVTQATAANLNATIVGTGTLAVQNTAATPAGTNLIGQVSASNETSTVYSGTTALTPGFALISTASSGASSLVSAVASKKIRVLALSLVANGAVNVKFQSHVTPTDLTGLYYLAANGGIVLPYNPNGWFQTIAGEQLDINLSGSVAVGGCLTYVAV
jgi:hypothetical protein